MSDWINVSDQMPPEGELVLVYSTAYLCHDLAVMTNMSGIIVWHGERVQTWHDLNSSYGKATHWQRLTLPQKGDNGI